MLPHYPLRNRETKASTPKFAAPSFIRAIEALEDLGLVVLSDANSSIANADPRSPASLLERKFHSARWHRKLRGIVEQDGPDAPQGRWVAKDQQFLARSPLSELKISYAKQWPPLCPHFSHHFGAGRVAAWTDFHLRNRHAPAIGVFPPAMKFVLPPREYDVRPPGIVHRS